MTNDNVVKCVVIGDGNVGKTCLLIRYARGEFPTGYVPTIFDHYLVKVPIDDTTYSLSLYDTAGQEGYENLQPFSFKDADVFLLCFAVDNLASLENAKLKWVEDLRKLSPKTPFLLIGTKKDKRENPPASVKLVMARQAEQLAKEMRAVKYMECSAIKNENVSDVFKEALIACFSSDWEPETKSAVVPTTSGKGKTNNEISHDRRSSISCCILS